MFDIGFSEIVVCLVVGLVVIGPERLPEAVRTTGLWIGRFKRSLRETQENIERQVGMDDVRRQLHQEEMMRTLDNMKEEIETALNYERMGKKTPLETVSLNQSAAQIEHSAAIEKAASIGNPGVNENSVEEKQPHKDELALAGSESAGSEPLKAGKVA